MRVDGVVVGSKITLPSGRGTPRIKTRIKKTGKKDAANTPSLDELVRQRVADVDDARAAQRVAQSVARLEPHRPFLADGFPAHGWIASMA